MHLFHFASFNVILIPNFSNGIVIIRTIGLPRGEFIYLFSLYTISPNFWSTYLYPGSTHCLIWAHIIGAPISNLPVPKSTSSRSLFEPHQLLSFNFVMRHSVAITLSGMTAEAHLSEAGPSDAWVHSGTHNRTITLMFLVLSRQQKKKYIYKFTHPVLHCGRLATVNVNVTVKSQGGLTVWAMKSPLVCSATDLAGALERPPVLK